MLLFIKLLHTHKHEIYIFDLIRTEFSLCMTRVPFYCYMEIKKGNISAGDICYICLFTCLVYLYNGYIHNSCD